MASAPGTITIQMPRTEALALVKVANIGIRVVEALELIQSTATAERGINAINAALSKRG